MMFIKRILHRISQAIVAQRYRAARRALVSRYGENWREKLTR